MSPVETQRVRWRLLAISALFMVAVPLVFFPSPSVDDNFISFWPARSAALLNYNGVPVEQSSSALHVIVLTVVHGLLRVDFRWISMALSLGFGLAALAVLQRLTARVRPSLVTPVHFMATLNLPFLWWAASGMEQTMHLLLYLLLALTLATSSDEQARRPGWWLRSGGVLLAYALVRPEAPPMLLGILGLHLVWTAWSDRAFKPGLTLLALGIAVVAAVMCVRHAYYGRFFPQPVYAKVAISGLATLKAGFDSLMKKFAIDRMLLVVVVAALISGAFMTRLRGDARATFRSCWILLVAQLGFAIGSGGDWMAALRFILAAIPLACLCVMAVLPERHAVVVTVASLICVGNLVAVPVYVRSGQSASTPIWALAHSLRADADLPELSWYERYNGQHRRAYLVFHALEPLVAQVAESQHRRVTIASYQAGWIVYHLAERFGDKFEFIDTLGLSSRHIVDCTSGDRKKNMMGLIGMHNWFLADPLAAAKQCGFPAPDFIFGKTDALFAKNHDGFRRNGPVATTVLEHKLPGYEVVIDVESQAMTELPWLTQQIAVGYSVLARKDLVDELHLQKLVVPARPVTPQAKTFGF